VSSLPGRGHTDLRTLELAWGMERIDIPRAPGLGLMLEEIHYERSELISDNETKLIWVKNIGSLVRVTKKLRQYV
jgi:hypothetical protein